MLGSVAVIRSVQRAHHQRGVVSRSGSDLAARKVDVESRRQLLARNARLPRLEGELVENSRGLLGGESEQLRWVILETKDGTLSIWDKKPSETVSATDACAPRKVHSLDKLIEVDSNPSFLKVFLRFEGASLCLVATRAEDFRRWMGALSAYDINSTATLGCQQKTRRTEKSHAKNVTGPPTSGFQQGRARCYDTEPFPEPHSHFQCYSTEPNPEPAPVPYDLGQHHDKRFSSFANACRRRRSEDYDPGSVEAKAIQSSMGILDTRKGLCKAGYL